MNRTSVVGDFSVKPYRRANGTVEGRRTVAYPDSDWFPSAHEPPLKSADGKPSHCSFRRGALPV